MLSFKDLMSLVGEFLFRWSAMEHSLSLAILAAENENADLSKVRGTLKERLGRWRSLNLDGNDDRLIGDIVAQVEELRDIRNLIVHGLAGGNSAPDDGSQPHIRCLVGGWQEPTGELQKITTSELKHYIEAVDACWRGLANPHAFNYRL